MRYITLGTAASLLLLGACTAPEIKAVQTAEPMGDAFTKAMTEEYQKLAASEYAQYDEASAKHYAMKGLQSAEGDVVLPNDLANWDLTPAMLDEMGGVRERLMTVMDAGSRGQYPDKTAFVQGRFDCWVEQSEENNQPDHISECRDPLMTGLEELEVAMTPEPMEMAPAAAPEPTEYTVNFNFDSTDVVDASQGELDRLMMDLKEDDRSVVITGHTDLVGREAYNMGLSSRRADAIKAVLVEQGGIDAARIETMGEGMGSPAVDTQRPSLDNRRAVIIVGGGE